MERRLRRHVVRMMEIGHIEYPTLAGGKRRVIDMSSKPRNRKNSSASVSGPWDYTIDNTAGTVTIESGSIYRGVRNPATSASTEISITTGSYAVPAKVYVKYNWVSTSISILGNVTGNIHSDASDFMVPLHEFYMSNGSIKHKRQLQFSDIVISGNAP